MTHRATTGPIVLVGMMGVGKTQIAPMLAARLGVASADLDQLLAARFGCPVGDWIRTNGEPAFRVTESVVLRELLESESAGVIATGGGAVLDAHSQALLRDRARIVWLRASAETIASRIGSDTGRPMLDGPSPAAAIANLLSAREAIYRDLADVIVDTDEMNPREVVDLIEQSLRRESQSNVVAADGPVRISGIGSDYEIHIRPGAIEEIASRVRGTPRVIVVTQRTVLDPWATHVAEALEQIGVAHSTVTIDDGEQAKRFGTVETLCRQFATNGLLRNDAVIALGGGVVGDVAGFAAAVYHRGIRVHQVPTTLLAMVDSSVGGKTAVNLPEGKNLAGVFHQPASVTIDPEVLSTLPEREYVAGLGEIAKYALMGPEFEDRYGIAGLVGSGASGLRQRDPDQLAAIIRSSVQLKADIVMEDPEERSGRRALLNYGHTLAHALEIATDHELLHGEAVAIGLIFAAELATELGYLTLEAADRHYETLALCGLPTAIPNELDGEALIALMHRDKKADGGLTFILRTPDGLQRVDNPPIESVRGALQRMGAGEAGAPQTTPGGEN